MRGMTTNLVMGALVACVSVAMVATPALAERRPSIIVAEQAVQQIQREAEELREKFERIAQKALDRHRHLAGDPTAQAKLFRAFNVNSSKLQRVSFFGQRRIARIQQDAVRRLQSLEPDFEAEQMVQDLISSVQAELSGRLQQQQGRLQQLFAAPSDSTPDVGPNGFSRSGGGDSGDGN